MLEYFLKSSACLAIFMLFYVLFLEKESMHKFKRFYLMASLLLAFVIPLVTFTEYVEVPPSTEKMGIVSQSHSSQVAIVQATQTDYLPIVLWSIYVLGVILFGSIFLKNLYQIIQRIRKNPKYRTKNIIQVLLNDHIAPHTFFQYIFLNKNKFEAKEIPEAVLLHEEIHAKQKHSLDVLCVELLQVLFWFNPLLFIIKKAIKLNHEFLADQAVVKTGIPTGTYQSLLLAFSSNAIVPQLANSINYSSTRLTIFGKTFTLGPSAVGQVKKRISVMKKQTSNQSIALRSVVLLPLFAVLLFGFGNKELVEVVKDPSPPSSEQYLISEDIIIHINKNGELLVHDNAVAITDLYKSLLQYNADLSKAERDEMVRVLIYIDNETPTGIIQETEKILKTYGVATIDLREDTLYVPSNEHQGNLEDGKIMVTINSKGQTLVNNTPIKNIPLVDYLEHLLQNNSSGPLDKLQGIIFLEPNTPKSLIKNAEKALSNNGIRNITLEGSHMPDIAHKEKATPEMVKEYNGLAKKYNAQPQKTRKVSLNDLKTLEDIYRVMTPAQKENAQPFPECPPPLGQEPATKIQVAEYNALAKKYYELPHDAMSISKKDIERINYLYTIMTAKQKADAEPFPFPDFPPPPPAPDVPEMVNNSDLPPPPPIPADAPKAERKAYEKTIKNYEKGNPGIKKSKKTKDGQVIEIIEISEGDELSPLPPPAPYIKNGGQPSVPSATNTKNQIKIKKIIKLSDIHEAPEAFEIDEIEKIEEIEEREMIDELQEGQERIEIEKDMTEMESPDPPEPPMSPIDHIVQMAKENATFYFEGKKINSDKAIDILKKNDQINLDINAKDGKPPVVKLSKEPIEHKD